MKNKPLKINLLSFTRLLLSSVKVLDKKKINEYFLKLSTIRTDRSFYHHYLTYKIVTLAARTVEWLLACAWIRFGTHVTLLSSFDLSRFVA